MKRFCFAVLLAGTVLSPLVTASAQVRITEFMASNARTLADETGSFEDWIEIHNSGATNVPLLDWSLTDDVRDLAQWRFPATNLQAGAYMIVFASGKNRRTPGAPLHTNFKLDASGEYLALVDSTGTNIVSQFAPRFSRQLPDVSFGLGVLSTRTTLIATGAPVRVLVPSAGNGGDLLAGTWTGAATNEPFSDAAWGSGLTGVGFSSGASLVAPDSMAVRFTFDTAPVADSIVDAKPSGTPHDGVNAGAAWISADTDSAPVPVTRRGVLQFAANDGDQVTVSANPDFNSAQGTIMFWMRSAGTAGGGNSAAILFDRRTGPGDVIYQQDDGKLGVQATSGPGQVRNSFSISASVSDDRWHHVAYVYNQAANGFIALYLDGSINRSNANTAAWSWDAAQQIELGRSHDTYWRRYNGLLDDFRIHNRILTPAEIAQVYAGDEGIAAEDLGTNIQGGMFNANASAFLRIPFMVETPTNYSMLTLRLKYDDGYVAWINGEEVARANAPETLTWNASATQTHASSLAESVVIGNVLGLLRPGTNILALQGLNVAATNGTFLLLPELIATIFAAETTNGVYFTAPTPGAANLTGSTIPGPLISEVQHAPNVPLDLDDSARRPRVLGRSFYAVSNVLLRYRIMFSPEVTVPMNDRGTDGDAVAGDGVVERGHPGQRQHANGQMIRYYVSATDAACQHFALAALHRSGQHRRIPGNGGRRPGRGQPAAHLPPLRRRTPPPPTRGPAPAPACLLRRRVLRQRLHPA